MMSATRLLVLLLGCTAPGVAWAADPPPCRGGWFTEDDASFGLATVIGAPRVYFRKDIAPCPDVAEACRAGGYLVPGDAVITGRTTGAFVCTFFAAKKTEAAGYLRQDELRPQPTAAPGLSAWAGTWHDGDNCITLTLRGRSLAASGEAYWPSANPPASLRPGGPHIGEMNGEAAPQGNSVTFAGDDADDCRVKLVLLPPFLLAADNHACGGANVSFSGVYRR